MIGIEAWRDQGCVIWDIGKQKLFNKILVWYFDLVWNKYKLTIEKNKLLLFSFAL